jgi:hypothetical protein
MEKVRLKRNQQSTSKAAAGRILQQKNDNRDTSGFADNRPEAAAQRRLIETISNSPKAREAAQLKTIIRNSPYQVERNGLISGTQETTQRLEKKPMQDKPTFTQTESEIPATNQTHANLVPGFKRTLQRFGNRERLDHEPIYSSQLPDSQYHYADSWIKGPYSVPSKVIANLGKTGFGPNVQNTPLSADVKSLRPYTYESAHMLAKSHGGTLGPGNIVPLLLSANKDMLENVENKLYDARYKGAAARAFRVKVTPTYGVHTGTNLDTIEQYTPTQIDYSIEEYEFKGKKWNWDNWNNWKNQGNATTLGYKKTINHNPSFNHPPNKSGHTLQEKDARVSFIVNEAINKAKEKSESEVGNYLEGIEKIKWYYLNKLEPASPKVFESNEWKNWDRNQEQVFADLIFDLQEFLNTGELSEILEEYEIKKNVPGYW